MMPEVSGSVANAVHPSSSQSKTAHTRSSDGVLTAHHDTSFGPARRRGHRLRDHRRPRHAWDLSTSVGRTIDFPAETITTMPDVVALTCTDHTVELGLVKPPTEPPANATDTERLMATAGRTIPR